MTGEYIRFVEIFNPDDYLMYGISIVGLGGIGSPTAMLLAKMGFKYFELWDDDKVEPHNVSTQMYFRRNMGSDKVIITDDILKQCNIKISDNTVKKHIQKFTEKDMFEVPIVISAVDNMKSRKIIFENALKSNVRLLIDGRMGGEMFTIYTVNLLNEKEIKKYTESFHEDVQLPCTARAINYNTFGISSFIVRQLIKVLNNEKYPREINFDYKNLVLDLSENVKIKIDKEKKVDEIKQEIKEETNDKQ